MLEITVEELKARLGGGEKVHLLDVREPEELALSRMDGAEHIPMMTLFLGIRKPDCDPDSELVVLCHHGIRSLEAARLLRSQGFARALSLAGGIDAWSARIDPTVPRY